MSNPYGANQYKQMAIKTANRSQLLIMLYEACINHVKKATAAIERRDLPAKGHAVGKAHDILNELLNTLDFEVGGNIARDLERLYNYMIGQLIKANMGNDIRPLMETQKLLETLLSGWKEAILQLNRENGQGNAQGSAPSKDKSPK